VVDQIGTDRGLVVHHGDPKPAQLARRTPSQPPTGAAAFTRQESRRTLPDTSRRIGTTRPFTDQMQIPAKVCYLADPRNQTAAPPAGKPAWVTRRAPPPPAPMTTQTTAGSCLDVNARSSACADITVGSLSQVGGSPAGFLAQGPHQCRFRRSWASRPSNPCSSQRN
jgi:hypothetical protein